MFAVWGPMPPGVNGTPWDPWLVTVFDPLDVKVDPPVNELDEPAVLFNAVNNYPPPINHA